MATRHYERAFRSSGDFVSLTELEKIIYRIQTLYGLKGINGDHRGVKVEIIGNEVRFSWEVNDVD